MSEMSARYRKVAGRFSDRVREVPADRWSSPAPCEGWTAADVVGHLVGWVPAFFGDELPLAGVDSWEALDAGLQAALDDPEVAGRSFTHPMAGTHTIEQAIGMFVLGDVLVHTWDLARATGLDESLDPDEVHGLLAGMEPMDEVLRSSGHYGPKVDVPADADEQTRLLAFTGRQP